MTKDNNYNYTPLKEPMPITEQQWPEGTLPLVTTRTITYMHEPFIRDCIEGILMQKTTFPIEVVIHDDASTDKTAEIVREYQAKHPRLIKAICQKENQYSKPGYGTMREDINKLVRGKYIAMCEGDDYWTDPLKLQKQVEFLEGNEEYVLVSNNRIIVDEKNSIIERPKFHNNGYYTQCVTFRNIIKSDYFKFNVSNIYNGDTFLLLYLENFGKFKVLDFYGSAYRISTVGIYSSIDYETRFKYADKSLNSIMLFFKNNNYNKSLIKTKRYKLYNYELYFLKLKRNKKYVKSLKYYFKFLFYVIVYRQFSLYCLKTSVAYFLNTNTEPDYLRQLSTNFK